MVWIMDGLVSVRFYRTCVVDGAPHLFLVIRSRMVEAKPLGRMIGARAMKTFNLEFNSLFELRAANA